jgi:hypothetical protein
MVKTHKTKDKTKEKRRKPTKTKQQTKYFFLLYKIEYSLDA